MRTQQLASFCCQWKRIHTVAEAVAIQLVGPARAVVRLHRTNHAVREPSSVSRVWLHSSPPRAVGTRPARRARLQSSSHIQSFELARLLTRTPLPQHAVANSFFATIRGWARQLGQSTVIGRRHIVHSHTEAIAYGRLVGATARSRSLFSHQREER
jgi:hypothetical protein